MADYYVFSAPSMYARLPNVFKRLHQSQPGDMLVPQAPFIPDFERELTTFIIRRAHRRWKNYMNAGHWATYYTVSHYSYIVATLAWSTGAIEELSNHGADKAAAVKELKRLVKAGK